MHPLFFAIDEFFTPTPSAFAYYTFLGLKLLRQSKTKHKSYTEIIFNYFSPPLRVLINIIFDIQYLKNNHYSSSERLLHEVTIPYVMADGINLLPLLQLTGPQGHIATLTHAIAFSALSLYSFYLRFGVYRKRRILISAFPVIAHTVAGALHLLRAQVAYHHLFKS